MLNVMLNEIRGLVCSLRGYENFEFGEEVYDDKDCIEAVGYWKWHDVINGYSFEWVSCWGEWMENAARSGVS